MNFLEVFRFSFEWDILEGLFKLSGSFLDKFALFISELGSSLIILLIITLFYWVIDKEKGKRIAFICFFGITFNNFFKACFSAKRPFEYAGKEYLDHGISIEKNGATGSSFPSGHSQNSATLYGSVFYETKNTIIRVVCVALTLLVCLSRIYLGVHFPGDVICGLCLGIATVLILETILRKVKNVYLVYIVSIILMLPTFFLKSAGKDFYRGFGLLVGFVCGALFDDKCVNYETTKDIKKGIFRYVIGLAIVGVLYLLINVLNHLSFVQNNNLVLAIVYIIDHAALAFVGCGIVPLIFKKIKFLN